MGSSAWPGVPAWPALAAYEPGRCASTVGREGAPCMPPPTADGMCCYGKKDAGWKEPSAAEKPSLAGCRGSERPVTRACAEHTICSLSHSGPDLAGTHLCVRSNLGESSQGMSALYY